MHTLLLEEYGVPKKWVIIMDKRQNKTRLQLQQKQIDFRLKIVTVPGLQEKARRNGVETEKNKDKSSNVTCDDVHWFL